VFGTCSSLCVGLRLFAPSIPRHPTTFPVPMSPSNHSARSPEVMGCNGERRNLVLTALNVGLALAVLSLP
jgi:hypothetical protein